ncbi:MAG: hypothetical protein KJ971_00870, partial [Firmicutes bacterium]|nr:hypothetical protein [Bacillota bacterium]
IYQLNPLDLQKMNTFAKRRNYTLFQVFAKLDSGEAEYRVLSDITKRAREVVKNILADTDFYLDVANTKPTGEVLYLFLHKSGLLKRLINNESLANEQKVRNIASFFGRVQEFKQIAEVDRVSEFIKHLEVMRDSGENPESSVVDQDADAIHILTIHKSKGLEFPICYYAGLDKKFNYSENKSFFVFDKEYGLITKSFDNGFKDTIYHILLKRKNYQSYVSERIRLFYVALTRAKEKMILVTNVSKWKNTNLIYNNLGYLDVGIRRKFSSYTDVLSSIPSLSSWFQNIDIKYESIQPDSQIALSNKFEPVSYLKFNFDAFCKEEYHFSKNSISLYSKAEKEAMHFGTMLHEALEHFDFKNVDASLSNLPVFLQDKLKPLLISFPFQNIEEAEIYQEYEFYDETIDTTQSGIIDLMLVYKSKVYLIDYKLKNTDESAYLIQLNGYADYIRKITKKPVDTYLYSLLTNELICLKED